MPASAEATDTDVTQQLLMTAVLGCLEEGGGRHGTVIPM